ncbi:MAG: response regulator [Thermoanaerobaculia bacterium]|nr:response regulator [Thermoanaerobaculia bacterium]
MSGALRHFDSAHGLINNDVFGACRDSAGDLWFATKGGAARLRPQPDPEPRAPRLLVTAMRVAGRQLPVAELGLAAVPPFSLPAGGFEIEIGFGAVDLSPGADLRYQVGLARNGDGGEWGRPVRERRAHLVGLAPGRYLFRARALRAGGLASVPVEIAFTVTPPLWRRPWVIALLTALAVALAAGLVRLRLRRLAALQRVRERIAADLHDELGLSLSRISMLAEVARRRRGAGEDSDAELLEIGESARELIGATSDMAWALDPRRDDLGALLARLRRLASDVFEGGGVRWRLVAPEGCERLPLGAEARRHLFLILKEAVQNAARHAGASAVEVEVALRGDRLAAAVRDDGRGFDAAAELAAGDGGGLAGMARRARELGGSCGWSPPPARGPASTWRCRPADELGTRYPGMDMRSPRGRIGANVGTEPPGRRGRRAMSGADGRIRVALVEDDRRTREALQLLIDGTPGFRCAAAFGSVEEVRRGYVREGADVVLLDINLPGIPGSDGVPLVQEAFPGAVVLMLTVFEDEGRIFRSLCNGARGYLLKRMPPGRLLDSIREAASGGAPMSPEIAAKVIALFSRIAPPVEPECHLSPQEVRLLQLLARGLGYQPAAEELGVSINTVRNHVRAIYEKLHVHSKSEAVAKALRAGLI